MHQPAALYEAPSHAGRRRPLWRVQRQELGEPDLFDLEDGDSVERLAALVRGQGVHPSSPPGIGLGTAYHSLAITSRACSTRALLVATSARAKRLTTASHILRLRSETVGDPALWRRQDGR